MIYKLSNGIHVDLSKIFAVHLDKYYQPSDYSRLNIFVQLADKPIVIESNHCYGEELEKEIIDVWSKYKDEAKRR